MSDDFLSKMVNQSLQNKINELKNEGLSDDEINKKIDNDILNTLINNTANALTDNTVRYFETSMYEKVFNARCNSDAFLSHNNLVWGKGFVASEAMYIIALEASKSHNEYINSLGENKPEDKEYQFIALREIHSRACQQYLEIVTLMKHGFADGAFARWRSLYELGLVAEFIFNNDSTIAKSYIEHIDSDNTWHNWAKAAPCFEKKHHITINDLQKKSNFSSDDWISEYTLSNKVVHGTPQGTFKRLGQLNDSNSILVGQSDYGFAPIAENSAVSLAIISTLYLSILPNGESTINIRSLQKWVEVIRKYYKEINETKFHHMDKLIEKN